MGLDADDFSLQLSTLQLSGRDDKIRNQVPGPEPISITHGRFPRSKPFGLLHAVPDAPAGDLGSDDAKLAVGRRVQTGGLRVSLSLIFERTYLNRCTASARSCSWARRRGLRSVRLFVRFENFSFSQRRRGHLIFSRAGTLRRRFRRYRIAARLFIFFYSAGRDLWFGRRGSRRAGLAGVRHLRGFSRGLFMNRPTLGDVVSEKI